MKKRTRKRNALVAKRPRPDTMPDFIPHEWTERPLYIRIPLAILGVILIGVGLVGWLMPVVPGFVLMPIGVVLLAASSKWWTKTVNALERKLPPRVRGWLHHPYRRHPKRIRRARTVTPKMAKSRE